MEKSCEKRMSLAELFGLMIKPGRINPCPKIFRAKKVYYTLHRLQNQGYFESRSGSNLNMDLNSLQLL
jgi:hypothetical protein